MVIAAKAKTWEEFGIKMEKDAAGNAKMLYRTLKNLRKEKRDPTGNIKDKKGEIITKEDKILRRWKEYFADLLGTGEEQKEEMPEENTEEEEREIERTEIVKAIEKIKVGKAPGIDNIRPEMMKYMGEEDITLLVVRCKHNMRITSRFTLEKSKAQALY